MSIKISPFGIIKAGVEVTQYILKNKAGVTLSVIDLGGTVTGLCVPDKNGVFADVVCGYDDPELYMTCSGYQEHSSGAMATALAELSSRSTEKSTSCTVTTVLIISMAARLVLTAKCGV